MARPHKATVDYFPHDCYHPGRTLKVLEMKYQARGYAFWFKLLEKLGLTENHYFEFTDVEIEFFSLETWLLPGECMDILNLLARFGAIDAELWETRQGVWCQKFVDRIADAYKERTLNCPIKPVFPEINDVYPGINHRETELIDTKNHKLNKTKLSKTKLKEKPLSKVEPFDRPNGSKINQIAEIWNQKAPPELARINLPFKRKPDKLKKLNSMIALYPELSWWEGLISKTYQSSFLRGKNNRGWKATFDFVVLKADEISDGKYLDIGGATPAEQGISTAYQWTQKREGMKNGST